MKRCPQCGRDYIDDTLSFCLDDGAGLLDGPASMDEPLTAILPEASAETGETPTRTFDPADAESTRLYVDRAGNAISRKGTLLAAAIGILVITGLGIGSYWFYGRDSSRQIESIAVMPFVNESGNADVEYLSDGMTEALISSLTEIPGLSVKARSTVFYYKGKEISPKKVGEDLGVEAVLLGRVVKRGENLKLSLELVDTKNLDAIWSKSYDRKMSDLVTLQSEIAQNVLDKLRSKLSSEDQAKVAKTYTANPEAQQLYLKGRFFWNKRTVEDFEKAEEYFKQAIALDPNYALAYSGLADTYILMPNYGDFSSAEYRRKTEQAAVKALELDSDLAEAHASLATISINAFVFKKAEQELNKAIELNPNYATAHHWLAETLLFQGRTDEAIKEIDRALSIDPYSPVMNVRKGFILNSAGRFDDGIAQLEKTIELYPDFPSARFELGKLYLAKKNYDRAAEEITRGWEQRGEPPEVIDTLRASFRKDGWRGLWTARLKYALSKRDAALARGKGEYFNYGGLALIYAYIGSKNEALEYLDKAFEQREPSVPDMLSAHDFEFASDDARYVELMKKFRSSG